PLGVLHHRVGAGRGEQSVGRLDEKLVGHDRKPLAATDRRISIVPPRMVNDGAVRMAPASRRSNSDAEAVDGSRSTSWSTRSSTSCSKRVPISLTSDDST